MGRTALLCVGALRCGDLGAWHNILWPVCLTKQEVHGLFWLNLITISTIDSRILSAWGHALFVIWTGDS